MCLERQRYKHDEIVFHLFIRESLITHHAKMAAR